MEEHRICNRCLGLRTDFVVLFQITKEGGEVLEYCVKCAKFCLAHFPLIYKELEIVEDI